MKSLYIDSISTYYCWLIVANIPTHCTLIIARKESLLYSFTSYPTGACWICSDILVYSILPLFQRKICISAFSQFALHLVLVLCDAVN